MSECVGDARLVAPQPSARMLQAGGAVRLLKLPKRTAQRGPQRNAAVGGVGGALGARSEVGQQRQPVVELVGVRKALPICAIVVVENERERIG